MSSRKWSVLCCLLGLLAFWPTLRLGFLWDDHEMIEKNPRIAVISVNSLQDAFRHDVFDGKGNDYFRPLQTIFNMIDYHFWGLRPLGYHITNLAFHLLAVLLLFSIIRLVFKNDALAFLTTALFAVNPIVVEQLIIIAGRAELMAAAFAFLSIRLAMTRTRSGFAGSLSAYALACLSKESGVIAPALLMAVGFVNADYRLKVKHYLCYALVFVLYMALRHRALPHAVLFPNVRDFALFSLQELPTVLTTYLGILLFPTDLHSHRRMFFQHHWMFLSPVLILLIFIWAIRRKSPALWFGLAWFAIALLPKLPLLATNSLMLDHWAYISGIGVYLWIAAGLTALRAPLFSVLIIGGWVALGWLNISRRKNDKELYQWALRFPTSSIVRSNLGLLYYQEGDYGRAVELSRASLAMSPDNPGAENVLALSLWKSGHANEAAALLNGILAKLPGHVQSRLNRALIIGGKEGLADVEFVLTREPENELAQKIKEKIVASRI